MKRDQRGRCPALKSGFREESPVLVFQKGLRKNRKKTSAVGAGKNPGGQGT